MVVSQPEQLLWGPAASGALGDVRLENGRIVAVIGGIDRAAGFAATGGNLIDLAPLPGGEDHLNQVFLYLTDEFPRQARYRQLEIVSAGGGTRAATVVARGVDTHHPAIGIVTEYTLEPGATWLTITSRFTSSSTGTIKGYAIGDALQWGRAEHFAPGFGYDISGKRIEADWIGGIGLGTSYAFVPDGPLKLKGPNGSMWSDPIGLVADLVPGKPVVYVRHAVVGRGDTASMQRAIARLRGDQIGRITGTVRHEGTPARDAVVQVMDPKGKLVGLAKVDEAGWYAIDLMPGEYRTEAAAPGRKPARPGRGDPIRLEAGATESLNFNLGPEAAIAWRIEGDDGRAPPIKVTFTGTAGTPDPYFGPLFRGSGSRNIVLSARGVGAAPVGVGRFRVIISRGPEYELIEQEVEVTEGARPEIRGKLVRSVDTRGFIAADMHQHAVPSFDSGVSLEDRALSNAAEGVEVLVSTEHNAAVDYRPVIAAEGLGRTLATIIGTEATTHSVGHFNVFPLHIRRDDPRGGMSDPEGWTPLEIVQRTRALGDPGLLPFVQVNHPRAGSIGYFDLMKLDPARGTAADPRFITDFDGVEVLSFGYREETDAVLEDWFSLLRRGHRITATGNSDSHTIYGREVGWARTLVCVDDDDPPRLDTEAFIAALRRGCATLSAGPFITIRSGEARMGDLLAAPGGQLELEVVVRAPSWIPTDRLRILVDGKPVREIPLSGTAPERHHQKHAVSCAKDCFVLAIVDSDADLFPILPRYGDRKPSPLAITNPIFVDVDRDGRYARSP